MDDREIDVQMAGRIVNWLLDQPQFTALERLILSDYKSGRDVNRILFCRKVTSLQIDEILAKAKLIPQRRKLCANRAFYCNPVPCEGIKKIEVRNIIVYFLTA